VLFHLQPRKGQSIYVLQNLFHGQVDFFSPPIPSLFDYLEDPTGIDVTNGAKSGIVNHLIEKGFLYRTPEEEDRLVQKYAETAGQRDLIIARHRGSQYGFLPTYTCNLRCPYCFQRKLPDKSRVMTEEMVDLAFDAIDELESKAPKLKDELAEKAPIPGIAIAGGEPLLRSARQRRALERIIQCSEERRFKYSITTNGVELEDCVDLFDRTSMITDIQVTIDGPGPIHYSRRKFADGRGSFHIIESGVNAALKKRLPLSLRVNLDLGNIDYLKDLATFILESGWLEAENFHCYVSPVTDNSGTGGYERITDESLLLEKILALHDSDPNLAKVFDIKHFRGFDYIRKLVEEKEPKMPVLYRFLEEIRMAWHHFQDKIASDLSRPDLSNPVLAGGTERAQSRLLVEIVHEFG
jgi:sulfatase maturation enzyme AslB (radical SAM superfamily)